MSKVIIDENTLHNIGDAIREKEGSGDLVPVNEMASRIANLSGGSATKKFTLKNNSSYGVYYYINGSTTSNYINGNTSVELEGDVIRLYRNKYNINLSSQSNGVTYLANEDFSSYYYIVEDGANLIFTVEFGVPVTPASDFTLATTTVDGVSGYKVTAYNGTDTEINIPEYNTDGLPILECIGLSVPKINGLFIKSILAFKNNTTITEINFPNTSNVTDMFEMFYNCPNLTTIHQLDTSNVTDMRYMFYGCSSLTSIPQLDTSNVTDMRYMFRNCTNLTTIPQLDTSNVTTMLQTFRSCSSLKSILMYGMATGFDISASTLFEREDLVTILNNLATVTSSKTLTMGSTNLAKLTDEDKAIATNKGWTLA